jgi:hypothetical protein
MAKEYLQFLRIARGSARETMERYDRMRLWLGYKTVALRLTLCNEIIAILVSTINGLPKKRNP